MCVQLILFRPVHFEFDETFFGFFSKKLSLECGVESLSFIQTYFVDGVARTQTELERAQMVSHQLNDHIDDAARWIDTSGDVSNQLASCLIRSRPFYAV